MSTTISDRLGAGGRGRGGGASMEYSQSFSSLKTLHPSTVEAIQSAFGYEAMSKVQAQVLSQVPTQRDMMVKAKTGTGKTLAFLVAALESLMALREGGQVMRPREGKIGCVIIAPTRELALQISEEAKMLLTLLGWGVQYLVGGESKSKQLDRISKEAAEFVVATPGRMKDLLGHAEFAARIRESRVLVLDEADTILQLGFRSELDTILESMPKDRQTFLFSATVDSKVDSLMEVALHNGRQGKPIWIDTVGEKDINLNLATRQGYCIAPYQSHVALVRRIINDHLLQDMDLEVQEALKKPPLSATKAGMTAGAHKAKDSSTHPKQASMSRDNKIIVFLPTTRGAQLYAKVFANLSMGKELSVFEMHSAKHQRERTLTSRNFKRIQTPAVMFTSDVSARGVDYPGVGLVIQVGAPLSIEHYIHRIGRTGRGDKKMKMKMKNKEQGTMHEDQADSENLKNGGKTNAKTKTNTKHGQGVGRRVGAEEEKKEEHEGKGILILGELDQGFIEHQLKPSPLYEIVKQEHRYDDWESVVLGESLDRGFKRALTKVDEKLAKSAYTAFLGYNLTVGPRIGNTDRKKILEATDRYIAAFGMEERPAVSISFLERMGFMKDRTAIGQLEGGQDDQAHDDGWATMELVDGTFPTVNTRITRNGLSSSKIGDQGYSDDVDDDEEEGGDHGKVKESVSGSRKERREAFEARTDVPETEYIKINEAEWEDFIEFKPGMPKLIEKLHSPKRMGHFGNRPSKKTSKIFSNNDGW
ncbi:hypothetical protein BGZ94_000191 [Podila epigama]|nr:hypothetical protein BGZ94_000191 [Podila epigama]